MANSDTSDRLHRESKSPTPNKRPRAKHACEPCRLRKRKCNGTTPCDMCESFEYTCYYEKHPRKRSKIVQSHAVQDGRASSPVTKESGNRNQALRGDRDSAEDVIKQRALEANSGIAFTRLLSSRLDPSSGKKLFTSIGWNLGGKNFVKPVFQPITDLLNYEQMLAMAKLYFENVHPLYGFLDRPKVLAEIDLRWENSDACSVPDHLFAGIFSCGTLFSDGSLNHILPALHTAAKTAMEGTSMLYPPGLQDIQSWLLRSIHMRATEHPHAVWLASCTTMHLVESTGIHQEEINASLVHATKIDENEREIRRRTFWIARILNTFVSFEYGRTRVTLHGITAKYPSPREGDYTLDYVNLYNLSSCLDPERSNNAGQWEDFLRQLEDFETHTVGIELSKANLAMCGYRRIRLANPSLSTETTNRIVRLGIVGLDAARTMMEKGSAWWHVVNVPFQVICVFLAMDVRESLRHVETAMRTLEAVVQKFHTHAMKEALKTARFLVCLSKRRKDEDSDVLGKCLEGSVNRSGSAMINDDDIILEHVPNSSITTNTTIKTQATSSSEDWNMDFLESAQFDWNSFLTADMSAFHNFAPDAGL